MEASETPQLPLDRDADGVVRAIGDRVMIEGLTVTDERAARVVRERAEAGQPAPETVTKAIEIGARVLDSEETAVNVDYVRAELERQSSTLAERLTKTLEAGDQQLAERIGRSFDGERDGSVQKDIEVGMREALDAQREALLKLFTAQDGRNPLFDFKDAMVKVYKDLGARQQAEGEANRKRIEELTRQIIELRERDDADRRVSEEAERGTAKGRTFEQLVHGALEDMAAGHGDAAHHTGDASSEAGGKMGDTIVEIGGALSSGVATVVFESKNKKLSKNDAWTELNGCMAERDAAYAVLVVAGDDKVPSGLDDLVEYQGNKMIVVLDRDEPDTLALRLVYRYVRACLLATGESALEVDAAGVRDAAEEATARLARANRVRKSLTAVTNGADSARAEFDEMVADVERCLTRIESLVAAAAPAAE
ncbi:MAG: hypothetical protein ACR2G3_02210 [Solirubrobacterales bacterium]